jgi:hypothetical protein
VASDTRPIWPRRNHSDAVVHGHLLISRIQVGIVAAGFGDAGLGVVRHHQLWHAVIELEGPYVSADPACQLLVGSGFGVGVGKIMPFWTAPTSSTDDRTDDCACGADDVTLTGGMFRKLRFLMIADTGRRVGASSCLGEQHKVGG